LEITAHDIHLAQLESKHRELKLPACVALERITGSSWRSVGCLMLVEVVAPFHFVFVPDEMQAELRKFMVMEHMQPCCADIALRQRDISADIYHSHTLHESLAA
jgi:hypothetical protein